MSKEMNPKNDITSLFIEELHDMLSAENQLVDALPSVINAVESKDLKEAIKNHLQETKKQVQRLEQIFKILGVQPEGEMCEAMQGLIEECNEMIERYPQSAVRDAAIIAKAQRIEHYEIAAYGTMRTFAKELDMSEIADLLQDSLDEEGNADKKLTKLAEGGILTSGINRKAHRS